MQLWQLNNSSISDNGSSSKSIKSGSSSIVIEFLTVVAPVVIVGKVKGVVEGVIIIIVVVEILQLVS